MSAAPNPDLAKTMHSIIQRIATGPELSKDISMKETRLSMRRAPVCWGSLSLTPAYSVTSVIPA